MSLNALVRWLKPREMVFFELLEGSAENLLVAARHFEQALQSDQPGQWSELRRAMKDFEHKGDDFTREIIDRLDQTFVTPIEREDILHLAHALDDVLDHLDAVSERLVLYRIGQISPAAREMSSLIVAGANELHFLVKSLRNLSNTKEIRERIQRVHSIEDQADSIFHTSLAELFSQQSNPIDLIKWKEIIDNLEAATDSLDLVAKVIGSTVMKNA